MNFFKPSQQQAAVFGWVRNGRGSSFVEAVAGAGKTTTIVEACRLMTGSIAFAAYNKKIADEIQAKVLAEGLKSVTVGTFHSFGFRAWRKVAAGVKLDDKKSTFIADELQIPDELRSFVKGLVSLGKSAAVGLFGSIDDDAAWWQIVDHHDLSDSLEDPKDARLGVAFAQKALHLSKKLSHEVIDFDDMIYQPVVTSCRVWQNDWLLVDEAQDLNPARRALARKMLRPNGRAIFVGDRHQAIYGFTGADAESVQKIVADFRCVQLPLTITYRCPKAVVAAARAYVNHIEAHPTAPEGAVRDAHEDDLLDFDLGKNDAVLCRLTAPLVKTAFRFIKAGIACHVEGRDIGAGLAALANRWAVKSLEALRTRLDAYAERETEKLIAKGQEVKAEAVRDRVDTLNVLMEGCKTLDDLHAKIAMLFANSEDGHRQTLTLSTVHKSKGREWDRVFILGFEEHMPSKFARQQWQIEQENNLIYVAFTRAKRELLLVSLAAAKKAEAPPAAAAA